MSWATRIRRDALANGYHPYQTVNIGWPRKYTGAVAPIPVPVWEETKGLEETERGLEQEVVVQLIREEARDTDQAVTADAATTKAAKDWIARAMRNPRQRAATPERPSVDLTGAQNISTRTPGIGPEELQELQGMRAVMMSGDGPVEGHAVGVVRGTGITQIVVFVGTDRFAGARRDASSTPDGRWIPARRWCIANVDRVAVYPDKEDEEVRSVSPETAVLVEEVGEARPAPASVNSGLQDHAPNQEAGTSQCSGSITSEGGGSAERASGSGSAQGRRFGPHIPKWLLQWSAKKAGKDYTLVFAEADTFRPGPAFVSRAAG